MYMRMSTSALYFIIQQVRTNFLFFLFFVVILQVVKNNLNPSWMSFSIALATLCGGDYDAPIRVSSIIMIIILIIIIIIIINSNYYQFNLKVHKICVT